MTTNTEESKIIGYKAVMYGKSRDKIALAKLHIIGDIICMEGQKKLRTSKAIVLSIKSVRRGPMKLGEAYADIMYENVTKRKVTNKNVKEAYSIHDPTYRYEPGDVVEPVSEFDKRLVSCASGVHFFLDKNLAMQWPERKTRVATQKEINRKKK